MPKQAPVNSKPKGDPVLRWLRDTDATQDPAHSKRRAGRIFAGPGSALLMFVVFFVLYYVCGMDAISSRDFAAYPFGVDAPVYIYATGNAEYHILTAWMLEAYRSVVYGWLGLPESAAIIKLPFAIIGALGTVAALTLFRELFSAPRSFLFAACYGSSLMVWYFASIPESYGLTALLYTLYILVFVKAARNGITNHRTVAAVVVLTGAMLNDISAGILLAMPVIYYGLSAWSDRRIRAHLAAQIVAAGLAIALNALATNGLMHYLTLFLIFSPHLGDSYEYSMLEPLLNFFSFNVAAPSAQVEYATQKFPDYVGFFNPTPWTYFGHVASAGFFLCYAALILFFRPAAVSRLIVALASLLAIRFVLVLLFNPGEAILYSTVALAAFWAILFHFLEASRFKFKTTFVAVLLAMTFASNLRFFLI